MAFLNFNDSGAVLLNEMKHGRMNNFHAVELNTLEEENKEIEIRLNELEKEPIDEKIGITYMLYKSKLDRNNNIRKTYLNYRLKKILAGNYARINLSEKEEQIKKEYENAENEYLTFFNDNTTNIMPLSLFIRFYTTENCGYVFDEKPIKLEMNKIYCMRRKAVIHLIELKKIIIID